MEVLNEIYQLILERVALTCFYQAQYRHIIDSGKRKDKLSSSIYHGGKSSVHSKSVQNKKKKNVMAENIVKNAKFTDEVSKESVQLLKDIREKPILLNSINEIIENSLKKNLQYISESSIKIADKVEKQVHSIEEKLTHIDEDDSLRARKSRKSFTSSRRGIIRVKEGDVQYELQEMRNEILEDEGIIVNKAENTHKLKRTRSNSDVLNFKFRALRNEIPGRRLLKQGSLGLMNVGGYSSVSLEESKRELKVVDAPLPEYDSQQPQLSQKPIQNLNLIKKDLGNLPNRQNEPPESHEEKYSKVESITSLNNLVKEKKISQNTEATLSHLYKGIRSNTIPQPNDDSIPKPRHIIPLIKKRKASIVLGTYSSNNNEIENSLKTSFKPKTTFNMMPPSKKPKKLQKSQVETIKKEFKNILTSSQNINLDSKLIILGKGLYKISKKYDQYSKDNPEKDSKSNHLTQKSLLTNSHSQNVAITEASEKDEYSEFNSSKSSNIDSAGEIKKSLQSLNKLEPDETDCSNKKTQSGEVAFNQGQVRKSLFSDINKSVEGDRQTTLCDLNTSSIELSDQYMVHKNHSKLKQLKKNIENESSESASTQENKLSQNASNKASMPLNINMPAISVGRSNSRENSLDSVRTNESLNQKRQERAIKKLQLHKNYSQMSLNSEGFISQNSPVKQDYRESLLDFTQTSRISDNSGSESSDVYRSDDEFAYIEDFERMTMSDPEHYVSLELKIRHRASLAMEDFEYVKTLGKGAYGKVYLVRKVTSGDFYAMKVIGTSKPLDDKEIQNILNERKIFDMVESEFCVNALGTFVYRNLVCFVLEIMQGGDLYQFAFEGQIKLDSTSISIYIAQMVLGIEHLHKAGIMHRDIKPANILVDKVGNLKLTDYGLSELKKDLCKQGKKFSKTGSLNFMAPEIFEEETKELTFGVDWYALGILIFDIIKERLPFHGESVDEVVDQILSHKIVWDYPEELEDSDYCFSPELKDLVQKLLEPDPEKRINSAEQIKAHPYFTKSHPKNWEKVKEKKYYVYRPDMVCDLSRYSKKQQFKNMKDFIDEEFKEVLFSIEKQETKKSKVRKINEIASKVEMLKHETLHYKNKEIGQKIK